MNLIKKRSPIIPAVKVKKKTHTHTKGILYQLVIVRILD